MFRLGLTVLLVATLGLLMTAPAAAQKRDRYVITRDELEQSSQKNDDLYAAVRSLRPHFLTAATRGTRSLSQARRSQPALFVNGNRLGEAEQMRGILTKDVEQVRFLGPSEAGMRFGLDFEAGAILVTLVGSEPEPPEGG